MPPGNMGGAPIQENTQEHPFIVNRDFIIANKETVLDFFGDSRGTVGSWYDQLNGPGTLHKRTSLVDSSKIGELNTLPEEEAGTSDIKPPLDLDLLLDKVDNIVTFFDRVPGAKEALKDYYEHELREKAKDVHPAVDDLYGGVI